MKVTDLLTDLLVVGFPALLWLVLFAAWGIDLPGGDPTALEFLARWITQPSSAYVLPFLVPCAYVLGVVVDRASDSALHGPDERIRKRVRAMKRDDYPRSDIPDFPVLRLAVLAKDGPMAEFVQYQRSRIRVARASVFNLALITLGLLLDLRVMRDNWPEWLAVLAFGVLATGATYWAWTRISGAYYKRVIDAYFLQYPDAHLPRRRIAKVLVRSGPHLLMSRKRSSKRAKDGKLEHIGGHLEAGEAPMAALLREAEEEETTGGLADLIAHQRPEGTLVLVGPTREEHHVFEITVSEKELRELQHGEKESHGFERVPAEALETEEGLEELRERLTPKTFAIHRALLERKGGAERLGAGVSGH